MPLQLFLIGFLVLFLEMASIRWFAAYVVFLQFFTNVVLLAAFLGMSCGCLTAGRREDWLGRFPALALTAVAAALATWAVFVRWARLSVDVGHQASPQEVFFGTELQAPDVARFLVPIEWIGAVFFVLVALLFVGLGQVLGRAFAAEPRRLRGYAWNIAGSLAGIAAFSSLSFAEAPPFVWFFVVAAGVGFLLQRENRLSAGRGVMLLAFVAATALPDGSSSTVTRWSPYYAIAHDPAAGRIGADNITHQTMRPFATRGAEYSLVHLLQRASGGQPFGDVLIIGAGSGNDLAHALRFDARHVDAVEIDPVIQDIGARFHPDRPYRDSRVTSHLDDGRHFLRTTDRRYDLVVYAVVDSLILHSSYSSIRLESFLFTEEAFRDIRRVLREDGVFVAYNDYRQGWILERVNAMAEAALGTRPLVLTIPHAKTLSPSAPIGAALVIAGANRSIAEAFDRHGGFWLNALPPRNLGVDGFTLSADLRVGDGWQRLAPATLESGRSAPLRTSDDWPFLYLRDRRVPDLTLRSTLLLGVAGLAFAYAFRGEGRAPFDARMFFLGAAFMLLEARAVVQMALLFGSTWIVNALVVGAVLVLVLLANLFVLRAGRGSVAPHYAAMFVLLAVAAVNPTLAFLGDGLRIALAMALALGPIFFSSLVFARSFQTTAYPDQALGFNIAGAVVGGLSESLSTLVGFRGLLLLVGLFALLSIGRPTRSRS